MIKKLEHQHELFLCRQLERSSGYCMIHFKLKSVGHQEIVNLSHEHLQVRFIMERSEIDYFRRGASMLLLGKMRSQLR